MSKAEDLLNSLSDEEIMMYSTAVGEEGHIIIGSDRTVTVPDELKKIAVQYDHNVETVTFDCPRYSDGVDMSEMTIYVNYMRPDGYKDAYPCNNIVVDETDPETMHFDWTITRNVTLVSGNLRFLVCVKKTDNEGNNVNHWNSDLCSDVRVGEGLECEEQIEQENPDTITAILIRINELSEEKANQSDIIDNLTTNVANKPLSAAQGVALKALIDGITIPDKLPNPQKLTFSGAVTAEYDGSGAVTVTIPEGSGGSCGTVRIEKLATDTAVELEPNKLYIFPEMSELTITLAEPSDTGIANEYHFVFQSGATATTLSIPDTVKLPSNFSVDASKIYEISILEGCLCVQSWAVTA